MKLDNITSNTIFVGIDYSLNSPSICIRCEEIGFLFFKSYFNQGDDDYSSPNAKKKKCYQWHNALNDNESELVSATPYTRITEDEDGYVAEQQSKVEVAISLAEKIVSYILIKISELIDRYPYLNVEPIITIEGFSYGSQGLSYIDLIMYQSILRCKLAERFGIDRILIVSPSHGKKLAGGGNFKKQQMMQAMYDNVLNDDLLENHPMRDIVRDCIDNHNEDFIKDKIKPLDDLVDSYFLCMTAVVPIPEKKSKKKNKQ